MRYHAGQQLINQAKCSRFIAPRAILKRWRY